MERVSKSGFQSSKVCSFMFSQYFFTALLALLFLSEDIAALEKAEAKQVVHLRKMASRDKNALLVSARSLVQAKRAKNRMFEVRATMKMMQNQLSQQAAILKVAGTMAKSAEIMKCLNSIMSTSKMSAEMQVLTKEMMKAGVVEDVFEEAFVEEGLEEEADYEVNKILMEVVPDMPDAPWRAVPEVSAVADLEYEGKGVADDGVTDAAEDPEVAALQARAGAL